jgi:hypothetical protein
MGLIGRRFNHKAKNGKWVEYTIIDTAIHLTGLTLFAKPNKGKGDAMQIEEVDLVRMVRNNEVELLIEEQ